MQHTSRWTLPHRLLLGTVLFIIVITTACSVFDIATTDPVHHQFYEGVPTTNAYLHPLLRMDAEHYLHIVESGYQFVPVTNSERDYMKYAFFPLYPLLAAVLHYGLGIPIEWSLLIVSWGAAIVAAYVCYLWMREELTIRHIAHQKKIITLAFFLIAAYPTSFFLTLAYTEGLFISLSVGSLLAYRKNRPLLAGILAALASATRVQGILLWGYYLIELIAGRRTGPLRNKIIPLGIAPLGLLTFMAWEKLMINDGMAFTTVQHLWGKFSDSLLGLLDATPSLYWWHLPVYGVMLYATYRTLGKRYALYCLFPLLLSIATLSSKSLSRYFLVYIPLFLGLAILLSRKHPAYRIVYFASAIPLLIINIVLHANGVFIE